MYNSMYKGLIIESKETVKLVISLTGNLTKILIEKLLFLLNWHNILSINIRLNKSFKNMRVTGCDYV